MSARIGIDLGGTKIAGVRLDDAGRIEASLRHPTPKGDYTGTIAAVRAVVSALDDGGASVGVGTPGVQRPADGLMKNCNSTWLNGKPLEEDLAQAIGQPVRIANDADCFALAEARQGAGQGAGIVFGVILGTGVGGGVVVGNRVLQGATGLTGEWGHTPLPYFGSSSEEASMAPRECYCGRLNCIETFLSGPGMARTHHALHGSSARPEDIAAASNRTLETTWHLYCRQLARSLAQVVNVLDPHVIVLGGGVSNAESLYARVNNAVGNYVFGGEWAGRVVGAQGGDAVGAVGAAWLWAEENEE